MNLKPEQGSTIREGREAPVNRFNPLFWVFIIGAIEFVVGVGVWRAVVR